MFLDFLFCRKRPSSKMQLFADNLAKETAKAVKSRKNNVEADTVGGRAMQRTAADWDHSGLPPALSRAAAMQRVSADEVRKLF